MSRLGSLPDSNQNFWQLTSIQSSAQSIPGIVLGSHLAHTFGAGTALISLCIGNLILWLIGLSMVSMVHGERKHALENIKNFLGQSSALAAGLTLVIAFMTWYVLTLNTTVNEINVLFQSSKEWKELFDIRLGAALGFFSALLVMGGMPLIRRVCSFTFPCLLFFILSMMLASDRAPNFSGTWGISLSAIISSMMITLPGFINLPTFFRHSRSRADSFFALTLITIFDILFSASSIFIETGDTFSPSFKFLFGFGEEMQLFLGLLFLLFSLISLNLVNIYFVSAGGEMVLYRNWNAKEYTIIGLLGTAAYVFLQVVFPMIFLENMTNNFIAILGVVLLMAFLTRIIVRHRPRPLERMVTNACWYAGCVVALILQVREPGDPDGALLAGIATSVIGFLVVIFVEETVWATKKAVAGA